ncbi:hypothetical protein TNCV_2059131 [Trichonephila clavipes]|nr:hypothetical protein TNCV_2059131 [Trichonephila clavipes]
MSSRHHIDDFMRGQIIGKIEGRKITDVAREFDIAHSVVSRLWKSFKITGMCSRRHGGGRVRSTTPADDRYIVLSAKRNSSAGFILLGKKDKMNRFVEWAQNEIAVVPDFHKRILFSDETHFWLNGYVNKQNCRIWSEANPQVYVETPLHPEKLTVWCALWAGGILLQKR